LLDAGLASREQRSGEELTAFGEAIAMGAGVDPLEIKRVLAP